MTRAARSGQAGVALAVVVWFIAAMALLVAGTVSRSTVDTRLAQAHLFRARAEAAGDGAVNLLLADLRSGALADGAPAGSYRVGDVPVQVLAVPVTALVDLNAAPVGQLERLFREHGNVAGGYAASLAASVVEWRRSGGRRPPAPVRFDVVEDLLRVEGMTRTRLDDIRHMVAAGGGVSGAAGAEGPRLDAVAESTPAAVLAGGLPSADRSRRGRATPTAATSYRIDAIVETGGRHWLRRRWVELGAGWNSALPWSTRRVEPVRAIGDGP